METEKRLYEAAIEGNVRVLQELLQRDGLILDRLTLTCCNETPLHIASMRGHVEVVKLILATNPHLAAELDSRKSCALHIASAKGYVEIVKELLLVNVDTCLARDRDGRNPLHLAAIKGHVEVIKTLIQTSPDAAQATTDNEENILHLCVKHNQLEALKLLIEIIGLDHELLNAKDSDGYTILHLAVADKQIEVVKYLLRTNQIHVNAMDANGDTALDILVQSWRHAKDLLIGDSLREAGGLRGKDIPVSNTQTTSQSQTSWGRLVSSTQNGANIPNSAAETSQSVATSSQKKSRKHPSKGDWLSKERDTLMVVASLIATMAFQAGMNPPGGVWQENADVDKLGNPLKQPYKAGESIMAYRHPNSYRYFLRANTIAFVASLSTFLLLISGLPFRSRIFMWILVVIMWLTVTTIALTFGISIYIVTPKKDRESLGQVIEIGIYVWCGVISLLLLGNTIRLLQKWLKKGKKTRQSTARKSSIPVYVNV